MSEIAHQKSAFTVLLTRPEQRDPMALAKALAAIRRTPVQDQIPIAKSCWGIVAEQLDEPSARILSELLKAAGLDCTVVPATSLIPLPETQSLSRFELALTEGLVLIAAVGVTVTTTTTRTEKQGPSTGQQLLSAGIMLTTGLPIHVGPKKTEVKREQTHSDLALYADLFYQNPFRRQRISAEHFDYSFLKERRLYQVLGNFKLLLTELVQKAPAAWRNHGVKVLLEGQPMNTMGYPSLADFERESRWLLTLKTL